MQTTDGVCAGRNSDCGFSPTTFGGDRQKLGCQESCSDSTKNNLARAARPACWAKKPVIVSGAARNSLCRISQFTAEGNVAQK
jgi:hypothetical protein